MDKTDKNEKPEGIRGLVGHNCYWITCGALAGATMGTGSFIFATRYSDYGLSACGVLGPPMAIICIIWTYLLAAHYRCKNGTWLKKENSRLIDENGVFKF